MANFSYLLKNFSVIVNDSQKLQKSCEDTHLKNYLTCERGIFTHWWQGCKFVLKKCFLEENLRQQSFNMLTYGLTNSISTNTNK